MGLNHPTLEVVFPVRMMNVRDIENLKEKRMNGILWMLRKMKNTPGKQSHFIEGQTNDKGSIDGDRFQQVASGKPMLVGSMTLSLPGRCKQEAVFWNIDADQFKV